MSYYIKTAHPRTKSGGDKSILAVTFLLIYGVIQEEHASMVYI